MSTSITAHQLLEKLVTKPIDSTNFPTHFNVVLRLREALNDQRAPFKKIIDILHAEPIVSARIVQAANAAIFYGKEPVLDVEKAVYRLGANTVRRIALGVAMTQLSKAKELLPFSNMARLVWLHSLYTAASASILARAFTQTPPDVALFSGLTLNLGAFYLLYQASGFAVLHDDLDDVQDAVKRHYLSLTHRVVEAIGLPEEVTQSLEIQSLLGQTLVKPPVSIQEVIYASNLLASHHYLWSGQDDAVRLLPEAVTELMPAFDARFQEIQVEYR